MHFIQVIYPMPCVQSYIIELKNDYIFKSLLSLGYRNIGLGLRFWHVSSARLLKTIRILHRDYFSIPFQSGVQYR